MTAETREILDRALKLPPAEKAHLVGELLASLDRPDEAVDSLWRKEVEERVKAYEAGELRTVSLAEVLAKYGK